MSLSPFQRNQFFKFNYDSNASVEMPYLSESGNRIYRIQTGIFTMSATHLNLVLSTHFRDNVVNENGIQLRSYIELANGGNRRNLNDRFQYSINGHAFYKFRVEDFGSNSSQLVMSIYVEDFVYEGSKDYYGDLLFNKGNVLPLRHHGLHYYTENNEMNVHIQEKSHDNVVIGFDNIANSVQNEGATVCAINVWSSNDGISLGSLNKFNSTNILRNFAYDTDDQKVEIYETSNFNNQTGNLELNNLEEDTEYTVFFTLKLHNEERDWFEFNNLFAITFRTEEKPPPAYIVEGDVVVIETVMNEPTNILKYITIKDIDGNIIEDAPSSVTPLDGAPSGEKKSTLEYEVTFDEDKYYYEYSYEVIAPGDMPTEVTIEVAVNTPLPSIEFLSGFSSNLIYGYTYHEGDDLTDHVRGICGYTGETLDVTMRGFSLNFNVTMHLIFETESNYNTFAERPRSVVISTPEPLEIIGAENKTTWSDLSSEELEGVIAEGVSVNDPNGDYDVNLEIAYDEPSGSNGMMDEQTITVTYTAVSSYQDSVSKDVQITIKDKEPPILELRGTDEFFIEHIHEHRLSVNYFRNQFIDKAKTNETDDASQSVTITFGDLTLKDGQASGSPYTVIFELTEVFNLGGNVTTTKEMEVTVKPMDEPVFVGLSPLHMYAGGDIPDLEAGVHINFYDIDVPFTINHDIPTTSPGDYYINYQGTAVYVNEEGNTAERFITRERLIEVIPTDNPSFNRTPVFNAEYGDSVNVFPSDFTAEDFQGNNLTIYLIEAMVNGDNLINDPVTSYTVDIEFFKDVELKYQIEDAYGNVVQLSSAISVDEAEKPTVNIFPMMIQKEEGSEVDLLNGVSFFDPYDDYETEVSGNFDPDIPGEYTVTYKITSNVSGLSDEGQRVYDIYPEGAADDPVIIFEPPQNVTVGDFLTLEDLARGEDSIGGPLPVTVENLQVGFGNSVSPTPSTYLVENFETLYITYKVTNNIGTSVERTYNLRIDTSGFDGPSIHNTPSSQSIAYGSDFDPTEGVYVYDANDSSVELTYTINGGTEAIDTTNVGRYDIRYEATNKYGQSARPVFITITVLDPDLPSIEIGEVIGPEMIEVNNIFYFNQYTQVDFLRNVTAKDYDNNSIDVTVRSNDISLHNGLGTVTEPKIYTMVYEAEYPSGYKTTERRYFDIREYPEPSVNKGPNFEEHFEIEYGETLSSTMVTRDIIARDGLGSLIPNHHLEIIQPSDYSNTNIGVFEFEIRYTDPVFGTTDSVKREIEVTALIPYIDANDRTVSYNEHDFDYKSNVFAFDGDGTNLTHRIEWSGSVDTSEPGEFDITVSVTNDHMQTDEVTYTITVLPPEIKFEEPERLEIKPEDLKLGQELDDQLVEGIELEINEYRGDPGYLSIVDYDGLDDVANAGPGDYVVVISYTQPMEFIDDMVVTVERVVTISDFTEPTIVVSETKVREFFANWDGFSEYDFKEGVSAHDPYDGDLTEELTYEGSVDISTNGFYDITYKVTGITSHISTEKVVTFRVYDESPPEIDNIEWHTPVSGEINLSFGETDWHSEGVYKLPDEAVINYRSGNWEDRSPDTVPITWTGLVAEDSEEPIERIPGTHTIRGEIEFPEDINPENKPNYIEIDVNVQVGVFYDDDELILDGRLRSNPIPLPFLFGFNAKREGKYLKISWRASNIEEYYNFTLTSPQISQTLHSPDVGDNVHETFINLESDQYKKLLGKELELILTITDMRETFFDERIKIKLPPQLAQGVEIEELHVFEGDRRTKNIFSANKITRRGFYKAGGMWYKF